MGESSFTDFGVGFILISADGSNWWGGYFERFRSSGGTVGIGNGQVLVTATGTGIRTGDLRGLNSDRPIWDDPNPDCAADGYLTFRMPVPVQLLGIGFWHSRFVAVGDSGAIYLSGTLPPYLSQISQSGNATTVTVEGNPLESHVLQSAAALSGPWESVSTNSTTADGVVTFTDPKPPDGGSRFYRVSGP